MFHRSHGNYLTSWDFVNFCKDNNVTQGMSKAGCPYDNAVSAGTGNFLVDGPKETIQLTKNIIPDTASYGVKISGDSMEPEFEDGQIAWVLKQDILENAEIGIFYLNGDAYIKKLQDEKNGVFLISLNEKYPPIPVGENDRFDILGKVVGKNHPNELRDFLQ